MPELILVAGGQNKTFPFTGMIVIGRSSLADFVLPDASVSRRHTLITPDGNGWFVEDLGSGNGTFLNDRIVSQRAALADGDSLRLGSIVLQFHNSAPERSSRPQVPAQAQAPESEEVLVRVPLPKDDAGGKDSARRLRLLENLSRISEMVFDEHALLSFVLDELFELIPHADRAFVMLWDPELKRLVPNVARTRAGKTTEIRASRTILNDALEHREAVLIVDAATDARTANAESIAVLEIAAAICTPIVFQNQIFGVIQIDSRAGRVPFTRDDVVLTVSLSGEVGMALAYARLHGELVEQRMLEHDLELARKIQQQFMPPGVPEAAGYSFAVDYQPALAVGGDLYDFIDLDPSLKAVVVGDVSGKGVSAALFAAKLLTELRYLSQGLVSPAAILSRVNDALASTDAEGMFVTAVVAVLNIETGVLTIANAGHPFPFARDRGGAVSPMGEADGPAIGMLPGAIFYDHDYELESGDVVLLYTDGVIEALNSRKEMFGESSTIEALKQAGASPDAAVRHVGGLVRAFAGAEPQSDDITIVAFGRD